jgi:SAM-dependent methyltransferase
MTRVADDHFAERYAAVADPWDLEGRWYETRKHRLTVAALPRRRYRRAFEPGCSIGLLTALLAERCDEVLATDVSAAAVAATRARCRVAAPGVHAVTGGVPEDWPEGIFDLVVLSEIGYYLDADALGCTLDLVAGSLEPGGHLVAVHFRPAADEHLQDGDAVHAQLRRRADFESVATYSELAFHLDVLGRRP